VHGTRYSAACMMLLYAGVAAQRKKELPSYWLRVKTSNTANNFKRLRLCLECSLRKEAVFFNPFSLSSNSLQTTNVHYNTPYSTLQKRLDAFLHFQLVVLKFKISQLTTSDFYLMIAYSDAVTSDYIRILKLTTKIGPLARRAWCEIL
jgi:hypothetical protein